MMRALWSAASGMKGQQTAVDTIANNLANVNTTAFKSQSTQFKTLLYQTLQEESTNGDGDPRPTSAQVGLGTRVASLNSNFAQGAMTATEINTDFCVVGNGFFQVESEDGEVYYTRDGNFTWAMNGNNERALCTSDGYYVLNTDGEAIIVPDEVGTDTFMVDSDGMIFYRDNEGNPVETNQRMALFQFANRVGLDHVGDNLYQPTAASGDPMGEWETDGLTASTINQGYVEGSNVNVADEMVNLIVAQRAYEMNSKAITTSDTMLEQANNLKR